METIKCQHCNESNSATAEFCEYCGAPLKYDEDVKDDTDNIKKNRIQELAKEELAFPAPAQECEDLECRDIRLEFNYNRFYTEKFSGVLEFKITNLTNKALSPSFRLDSDILKNPVLKNIPLTPSSSKLLHFQIYFDEHSGGEHLMNLWISYRRDNEPVIYCAEPTIFVGRKDESPSQVIFNMGKMVNLEDVQKAMGINFDINIGELVKTSSIKNLSELTTVKLPDNYHLVRLFFDHEETEKKLKSSITCTTSIIDRRFNYNVSEITSSSLFIENDNRNIVIISKDEITFGRNRGNDVILRLLPRSKENDPKSMRISGDKHFILKLTQGKLTLQDQSTNGTFFQNEKVSNILNLLPNVKYNISLAKIFDISIFPYPFAPLSLQNLNQYLYELRTELGRLWDLSSRTDIGSVKIERVNSIPTEEKYLLLFSTITIGSSSKNSICIRGEKIEEIHCRILNINKHFYLERLSSGGILKVNDLSVNICSLIPLDYGMTIEIGDKKMLFRQYEQKYIEKQ